MVYSIGEKNSLNLMYTLCVVVAVKTAELQVFM